MPDPNLYQQLRNKSPQEADQILNQFESLFQPGSTIPNLDALPEDVRAQVIRALEAVQRENKPEHERQQIRRTAAAITNPTPKGVQTMNEEFIGSLNDDEKQKFFAGLEQVQQDIKTSRANAARAELQKSYDNQVEAMRRAGTLNVRSLSALKAQFRRAGLEVW